jgi:hypothetical protein
MLRVMSVMRGVLSNNHIEQGEPLQLITELCNTKGNELDNESDSDCDY